MFEFQLSVAPEFKIDNIVFEVQLSMAPEFRVDHFVFAFQLSVAPEFKDMLFAVERHHNDLRLAHLTGKAKDLL